MCNVEKIMKVNRRKQYLKEKIEENLRDTESDKESLFYDGDKNEQS
jgi:hypothetical protein